jgi:soluble lytic murein transglycosylase-like protein
MRIRKQSKVLALHAACGVCLAGFLLGPSLSQAGQIATVTDQYGYSVFINANPAPAAPDFFHTYRLLPNPKIDSIIDRVSSRYQVDPRLIHAMIRVESNYDPAAISPKGAMGLMQLIPSTAQRFGVQNPFDPKQNIQGGVTYLKYLLHLFGGNLPLSLAAYNAGEDTVIRSGGIPAIPETEQYVRKITRIYRSRPPAVRAEPSAGANNPPPIVRYVDAEGIVHFTNVE